MTTKEYLEIATGIDKRIESLNERITSLRERAESVTPAYNSGGAGSPVSSDKVSNSVEQCVDYEQEITKIRDEFALFRIQVDKQIHHIPDNNYATLLYEKYIKGSSWETIAEKLCYSNEKYVRETLHSKALAEFDKFTPEKYRFVPVILRRDEVL